MYYKSKMGSKNSNELDTSPDNIIHHDDAEKISNLNEIKRCNDDRKTINNQFPLPTIDNSIMFQLPSLPNFTGYWIQFGESNTIDFTQDWTKI